MNILILGSTKGLGKELSHLCIEKGWNTIEVGRSLQTETKGNRTGIQCDLSSTESVANLISQLETLPRIDCLFWVAGTLLKGAFSKQNHEEIARVIDVNFRNVVPVVQFVWNQMQDSQTESKIVVVASSSGVKPRSDEAVYVATKHAQVGFARSLGLENKNPNLNISLILPGGMKTELWQNYLPSEYDHFLDPKHVAEKILSFVFEQKENYDELEIQRQV